MAETPPSKRRLALSEQVLIGLVLGITVGIFFGEMVGWLKIVGDVFIMLLQITVIPYISFSLITGLGNLRIDEVKRLALKGGTVMLTIWAITLVIILLTPLRYRSIVRALRTPLITAFATGSSLIVLPLLIEQSRQLIIDAKMFDAETQEDADAALKVLIPTAFTFPSPAVLLSLSFVLFGGWYVGMGLSADMYPILILVGVPSLFGGPVLTIPFLLDLVKLPSDLFQVFVSVDVINSRFGTLLAAMHYATVGLIGTSALVGGLRLSWARLVRVALIGSAMLVAVLFGLRAFYTYGVVAPYAKAEVLQSLQLLDRPQPAKVYDEVPPHLAQTVAKPANLGQIEERGVLRVCFQPGEYPSAFYNKSDPPQLDGALPLLQSGRA